MENKNSIFEIVRSVVIIALAAVIGFSFIACDDGNSNEGGNGGGGGDGDNITLSGNITPPPSLAAQVTHYEIMIHTVDWSWKKEVRFAKEGDVTSWSVKIPKFSASTTVYFQAKGFDSGDYISPLFSITVENASKTVYGENVSSITLNLSSLNFIQITGTVIFKTSGSPPTFKYLVVEAQNLNNSTLGQQVIPNVSTASGSCNFSINVPAQSVSTGIKFGVQSFINELWGDDGIIIYEIKEDEDGNAFPAIKDADVSGCKVVFDIRIPEERDFKDRWSAWADPSSNSTIDIGFEGIAKDICKVTVGGTPPVPVQMDGYMETYRWKASARYIYTGVAGKRYEYKFKIWTDSGDRTINVQYYSNDDTSTWLADYNIELNNSYYKDGYYSFEGEALPPGGTAQLQFQCADQTGVFYISDIIITEITESDNITLSGNITPPPSLLAQVTHYEIMIHTVDWSWREEVRFAKEGDATSWSVEIPKFSASTTVYFQAKGFDSGDYISPLFVITVENASKTIYGENVSSITLDLSSLNFIQITGTVIFKTSGSPPTFKYLVVEATNLNMSALGQQVIQNVNTASGSYDFSINVPAQSVSTGIMFGVQSFINELWGDDGISIYEIKEDEDGNTFPAIKDADVSGCKVVFDIRIPEERDFKDRWTAWADRTSNSVIDIEFEGATKDICKVTVGGTPPIPVQMDGYIETYRWKASAIYKYTGVAGKQYEYKFKIWTDSGDRTIAVEYYSNNETNTYLGEYSIELNDSDYKDGYYSFEGEALPPGGITQLYFQCADQTGVFYISDIIITEITK